MIVTEGLRLVFVLLFSVLIIQYSLFFIELTSRLSDLFEKSNMNKILFCLYIIPFGIIIIFLYKLLCSLYIIKLNILTLWGSDESVNKFIKNVFNKGQEI